MTRKPPIDKAGNLITPPKSIEPELQTIRETREYELITPLFGGGTETQKADPISVIRVPGIRGQLRFWWRACRAAQFADVAEMKKVEDLIWGSTENPSAVIIDLQIVNKGDEETAYWMEWNKERHKLEVKNSTRIAPYAAFPLQPDKDEQQKKDWKSEPVVLNVSFTLSLRFPSTVVAVQKSGGKEKLIEIDHVEDHIKSALWAWETFGGIGARTRRGFGALRLVKVNNQPARVWPADAKLQTKLKAELTTHVMEGHNHTGVPQLGRDVSLAFTGLKANALMAWLSLIEQFQNFRQARYGSKFGKSKWPEPNEIRDRAGLPLRIAEEAEDRDLVHKFPRAVFGLPIVFHLPHDDGKPDFHLLGRPLKDEPTEKDVERLSSPIILRPLACEGGKAVGLALVLHTEKTPPRGLYLKDPKGKVRNDPPPDAKLEKTEARLIDPLNGEPDVLQAFLNRLR